jgi:hypothetical protein
MIPASALALGILVCSLVMLQDAGRPKSLVTEERAANLALGTPESEVERLFGGPGTTETPAVPLVVLHGAGVKYWEGEEGFVAVRFDGAGKVVQKEFRAWPRRSVLRRFLSWMD